jgi:8-oxo-dGTP pyrophosphatase MutT (NUDIX family)
VRASEAWPLARSSLHALPPASFCSTLPTVSSSFAMSNPGVDTPSGRRRAAGLNQASRTAAAARREGVEETGLTDVALSPIIWTRESIFDWGAQHVHQHERFFFARIETWELPSTLGRRTRKKASNNIAGGRSRS